MDMLRQEFDPFSTVEANPDSRGAVHGRSDIIKKIAIPLGIILAGVGAVALIIMLEQPAEKKAEVFKALAVETKLVSPETITFSVVSQGTVVPRTETTLVTEVSGVVVAVSPKLQAGGFFKEGELLLTLDASDYEASVKLAQANLLGKKAQLTQEIAQTEQAEKEWALSGRSRQEAPVLALRQPFLEKAKAEVQFAEAELQQAQRKLERTQIRAPYDGLIKSKSVGLGRYLTVGTALAEIIAVDYAEVRLPLSDEDIGFLDLPTPRQSIHFNESDAGAGPSATVSAKVGGKIYQWPAAITRTEGVIDSRSRLQYAVAQIEDPYGLRDESPSLDAKPALPMGSFVRARIEGISVDKVFAIPRAAFRDNNTLMVRDAEGKLRLRKGTVLRSDSDTVYISEGLQPGDEVITTAVIAPVEGMAVRRVDEQGEASHD